MAGLLLYRISQGKYFTDGNDEPSTVLKFTLIMYQLQMGQKVRELFITKNRCYIKSKSNSKYKYK